MTPPELPWNPFPNRPLLREEWDDARRSLAFVGERITARSARGNLGPGRRLLHAIRDLERVQRRVRALADKVYALPLPEAGVELTTILEARKALTSCLNALGETHTTAVADLVQAHRIAVTERP